MTIKKIIQEELGKTLEEHGFKFTKAEPCFWPYEREKDGIRQEIVVARDRYEKGYIKMIFSTSAYGQRPKEFRDFVPEEGAKKWDYWGYESEVELRKVLREFKRLMLAYGFSFIEKMSEPSTDAIPTEEANRYLLEHHQELYIKYQKKLQVEEKEAGEVIDIIYEKLKEILNQSFSQVENLLIGLSALYGHTIIWGNKGEWNWDEKESACCIDKILGTREDIQPLNFVITVWDYMRKRKRKEIEDNVLGRRYERILIYYYRDHPEEIEYDD
ncbi:hypothetical protein AALA79_02355 [Lachnospiraceae bacterium 64-25]